MGNIEMSVEEAQAIVSDLLQYIAALENNLKDVDIDIAHGHSTQELLDFKKAAEEAIQINETRVAIYTKVLEEALYREG